MPTTYPRTQITRTPQVQHIIDVGSRHLPGRSPGEVLVALAAQRVRELEATSDPLDGLIVLPAAGRRVTRRMVEDALADED